MEKKMTKKEMFTQIMGVLTDEVQIDFLKHEIELLDKKSASKKPTKTQEMNEGLKTTILTVLSDEGMTASEVLASSTEFTGLSNQKITALLGQLVKEGKVIKNTDKKKSVFTLA